MNDMLDPADPPRLRGVPGHCFDIDGNWWNKHGPGSGCPDCDPPDDGDPIHDAMPADPPSPRLDFEYDEESRWLVENDGYGMSRIVASEVLPEFGRALVRQWTALASSPAPAGLDTFRRPRYRWTPEGMTLDPAGPYVLNHMVPPLDPALVDEHHVTTDDQLRAATRPAEDHEHYWVDGHDDETAWHCTICGITEYPEATRPAEDAGERP